MFERFTDRARRVVVRSQEQARSLGHNYIGTEHILLGLLAEHEGVAGRALESLEVSLATARAQVEKIIGRGGSAPSDQIPFTPRAKKVLELSLRESLQLGHSYIGTEHILLGLVAEGEGVAAQVLGKLGVDLDRARAEVLALLGDGTEPPDASGLHPVVSGPAESEAEEWQVVPRSRQPGEVGTRRCGFCGRGAVEVETLVVAPRACICGDCLGRARRLAEGTGSEG
jgi:ATP-dependent Clp protease ATP-binding subunit ClpC